MTEAQRAKLAEIAIKAILSEDMIRSSLVTACARHLLDAEGNMSADQWLTVCAEVYAEVADAMGTP